MKRRAAAVVAGLALMQQAHAGPWGIQPELTVSAEYQSNPQLSVETPLRGYGTVARLALPVDWHGERHSFWIRPTLHTGLARGASGLGVDDRHVDAEWTRAGERNTVAASAGWSRTPLFAFDVADPGAFDPDGVATNQQASLSWRTQPAEGAQLSLVASWRATDYQQSTAGAQADFRYPSARLQYVWTASPRTQWLLNLQAGRYTAPVRDIRTRDEAVLVGFTHVLAPGLDLSATYGPSRVTDAASGRSERGSSYSASLAWRRQRADLVLAAERGQQPSGGGGLALQTDASVTANFRATERLAWQATFGATRVDEQFAGFTLGRRDFLRASLGADYALSERWRLGFRLTGARLRYPPTILRSLALAGDSHGATLTLARSFGRTPIN